MEAESKVVKQYFLNLPQPKSQVQCLYVWIDGSLRSVRCKSNTWSSVPKQPGVLPLMEFCGSATDFEAGNTADFYAQPVKLYNDPFRRDSNKIVFCETYTRERLPTFANNRRRLLLAEEKCPGSLEGYSFHQSYSLLKRDGKPLSHMNPAYSPEAQNEFVCGRDIAEAHYRACLYAGVSFRSLEPITRKGQWKYTVGTCSSVTLGDDVWMSRFILIRVAEEFGVAVSFETSSSSCLDNIYAGIMIETENLGARERLRLMESLSSKFVHRDEHPLKVVALSNKILLTNISADVDPYSKINKILDVLKS